MDWFWAPDDWLTRLTLQRGIGLTYLIAYLVTLNQFRPLLGERGLTPVPRFVEVISFRQAPSIFHLRYSDRFLTATAWAGFAGSLAIVVGLTDRAPTVVVMLLWLFLWVLYVSIVNVGQTFYSFGWESLLCEAGFLAIFLGSAAGPEPPVLVIWLFRWLLFRVEFGAGLIKIRGDRCWRDLTCLNYHHETQPMPNPLSWYFHHLPPSLHRVEVLGNHFAQLIVPFGLLFPQPVSGIAGMIILVTQGWLVVSGNFSWLNFITMVLALSAFDSGWLHHVVPISPPGPLSSTPLWFATVVICVTGGVIVLSWWPVRNMVSRRQLMNASFNKLHLVNTYGAFGSVTRVRREVVLEGTRDEEPGPSTVWEEYEFKGKPGDVRRRPPQIAPYHLRLDWLMWFAALSPSYSQDWIVPLLVRLLENDAPTLKLLRRNPFVESPPHFVRARLYRYRFTTWRERRETGAWWARELVGEYLPAVGLRGWERSAAGRFSELDASAA